MINKKKKYKLGDFNYRLPKTFIAQHPEARRVFSKLMVVHGETGEIEHRKFYNIIDYMRKNDLLVLNNTKVFPARLFATKDRTDAKVEVFLLRELSNDLWEVMVRPARKVRIGNKLVFTSKLMCDVIDNTVSGGRVVRFEYDSDNFHHVIDRIGTSPLPPYINRDADAMDKKRYQTVYATDRGAVAAPTAGLHFTNGLLKKVKNKGVKIEKVTFLNPKPNIISNVTARAEGDSNRIKPLLIDQITSRVRWKESVDFMIKQGVNEFLEIGPGKVLSGLVKKISGNIKVSNINSIEDIKGD